MTNSKYPRINEDAGNVIVNLEEEMKKYMEVGKVPEGNGYNEAENERKSCSSCKWGQIGKIITVLHTNGIKITKKETERCIEDLEKLLH